MSAFAKQFGKQVHGLTRRAQILLANHNWPGNVREVENVIGHGCMMTFGDTIDVADLPSYLRVPSERPGTDSDRAPVLRAPLPPLRISLLRHRSVGRCARGPPSSLRERSDS